MTVNEYEMKCKRNNFLHEEKPLLCGCLDVNYTAIQHTMRRSSTLENGTSLTLIAIGASAGVVRVKDSVSVMHLQDVALCAWLREGGRLTSPQIKWESNPPPNSVSSFPSFILPVAPYPYFSIHSIAPLFPFSQVGNLGGGALYSKWRTVLQT